MKWLKKHGVTLALIAVVAVGLGLLLYPTFSDWWNGFHQSRAVMSYADSVSKLNEKEYKKILKKASDYNKKLARTGMIWKMSGEQEADYESQLKLTDDGIMGYINIPKINVQLPIYHGTDEKVLQVAIGHLAGTSLPVGGKGSHCVVSGHRGLPSARLFTDIDKIKEGDTWTMTVLNQTITYECDQIRIVKPTDLSDLTIEPGKDYCTLVTCTPYGINTHRLLVRGHRTAGQQGDALVTADALRIDSAYVIPFACAPILLIFFIVTMRQIGRYQKRRKRWEEIKQEFGGKEDTEEGRQE